MLVLSRTCYAMVVPLVSLEFWSRVVRFYSSLLRIGTAQPKIVDLHLVFRATALLTRNSTVCPVFLQCPHLAAFSFAAVFMLVHRCFYLSQVAIAATSIMTNPSLV